VKGYKDVLVKKKKLNDFTNDDDKNVNYLKLQELNFVEVPMRLNKSLSQELNQIDERKYGYCFYNASTTVYKGFDYIEGFVLHYNKLYEHGWNKIPEENLIIDVTFPESILDTMFYDTSYYIEVLRFNHDAVGKCIRETNGEQPFFLCLEKYLSTFVKAKEVVRALFPNAEYKDQYTSEFGKY